MRRRFFRNDRIVSDVVGSIGLRVLGISPQRVLLHDIIETLKRSKCQLDVTSLFTWEVPKEKKASGTAKFSLGLKTPVPRHRHDDLTRYQ